MAVDVPSGSSTAAGQPCDAWFTNDARMAAVTGLGMAVMAGLGMAAVGLGMAAVVLGMAAVVRGVTRLCT